MMGRSGRVRCRRGAPCRPRGRAIRAASGRGPGGRAAAAAPGPGRRGRTRASRRVPRPDQVVPHQFGDVAVVFDDQDVAHGECPMPADPVSPAARCQQGLGPVYAGRCPLRAPCRAPGRPASSPPATRPAPPRHRGTPGPSPRCREWDLIQFLGSAALKGELDVAFRLIPREEKFYQDFLAIADELTQGSEAARGDCWRATRRCSTRPTRSRRSSTSAIS